MAIEELVVARWSDRILDEVFWSIARDRPDLDPARLARTRQRMCAAVLDCLVEDYAEIETAVSLPDGDDRHVVAAAVRAGASIIVTFNPRDFPTAELARHGLLALHPDSFAQELLADSPAVVLDVLAGQAADLKNPRRTALDVISALERCGLARFAAAIRAGGSIG